MDNTPAEKSRTVLGIISLVIAILIGICFIIFGVISLFARDIAVLFVWAYPTLITAPIGIIIGLIAVFTKRAWLGLVLNALFLLINIGIFVGTILYGLTHYAIWR